MYIVRIINDITAGYVMAEYIAAAYTTAGYITAGYIMAGYYGRVYYSRVNYVRVYHRRVLNTSSGCNGRFAVDRKFKDMEFVSISGVGEVFGPPWGSLWTPWGGLEIS